MGAEGRFNVPRDLLGRALGIDQHMQFVNASQRPQNGPRGNDIFELAHDVFNLLSGNIAAGGGSESFGVDFQQRGYSLKTTQGASALEVQSSLHFYCNTGFSFFDSQAE